MPWNSILGKLRSWFAGGGTKYGPPRPTEPRNDPSAALSALSSYKTSTRTLIMPGDSVMDEQGVVHRVATAVYVHTRSHPRIWPMCQFPGELQLKPTKEKLTCLTCLAAT